jgi:Flp pilus assembly secretin CpaC
VARVLVGLLFLNSVSAAQDSAYCNLTNIRVDRLSNAVQLTIEADGIINPQYNSGDYFNMEAISQGDWANLTKKVTQLPFSITNARSRVASIIDVGVYPVSHVEVGVMPKSTDGVGLDLKVLLFTEAVPVTVKMPWGINTETSDLSTPKVWMRISPDQRSIVILITSNRAIQKPVERKAVGASPAKLSISREGDRYTIEATNASLSDVAAELGSQGGRDIMVDSGLTRCVSMNMPDATMSEILASLSLAYGLSIEQNGAVAKISEARADQVQAVSSTVTERLPLKHISAATAQQALPEFLLRHTHLDVQNNALSITGSAALVEKVKKDIEAIDKPCPLVAVDAVAVEFSNAKELESFINLAKSWTDNALSLDGTSGDIRYEFQQGYPSDWIARVRAVDSLKRVKINAKPTLLSQNGQKGSLFVGRQQLVKYEYFDYFMGMMNTSIMKVNIGASLSIVPVSGDGQNILLTVEPSLTTVVDLERSTGLPTVSTRTVKTSVLIKSGDTLVIGGLKMDQESRTRTYKASNRRSGSKESAELVWFITAKIVDPSQAPIGKKP